MVLVHHFRLTGLAETRAKSSSAKPAWRQILNSCKQNLIDRCYDHEFVIIATANLISSFVSAFSTSFTAFMNLTQNYVVSSVFYLFVLQLVL